MIVEVLTQRMELSSLAFQIHGMLPLGYMIYTEVFMLVNRVRCASEEPLPFPYSDVGSGSMLLDCMLRLMGIYLNSHSVSVAFNESFDSKFLN